MAIKTEKKRVLVIEDELPLLKILVEELSLEGLDVYSANDGEQGLKLALSKKPHLILLDLIMPKVDGITMLKKLRADAWGKEASVLILTNLEGDTRKTVEAIENGVFEFMVKSRWQLEDVKKRVKEKLSVA